MSAELNMVIELGFILLHFILFLVSYKMMRKKIMHPAVLYTMLWFGVLLLHLVLKSTLLKDLYDIKIQTLIIIFVGAFSFAFGSILISILKEKREKTFYVATYLTPEWVIEISPWIQFSLFLIVIFGLPYYIYRSFQVFLASNIDNFLVGLRTELSYGDTDLGPIKYLTSFSFFALGIQQYCYYRNKNSQNAFYFIATLVAAFVIAFFTTGRGAILWVVSILLGMNFLHGKRFSIRTVIFSLLTFLVFFAFIGIIFNKGGNTEANFKQNLEESTKVTGTYLVASINALDLKIEDPNLPDYSGNNSLRFFKAVGNSIGLFSDSDVPELVQDFVFVPYSTNVYTIYSTYFTDFGIYYAFFIVAFLGMLQTIIYNKAIQTKDLRYSIYFSLTLFPLFMSFFQDMYFSMLSTWIQILFYTEFLIIINRLSFEKRNRLSFEKR